ncbi:MAG TPA: hypothetical protein VHZ07_27630 [Bryobacteraceae bacterium]|jgi:hypothetical protein|nr:hypothetical protein [Bryobacteraceae bacterium]
MRFEIGVALFVLFGSFATAQTGTVTLTNYYYPWAQIEAGDYFTVSIVGAAHNQTVTVVENGGSPYPFGTTDDSGNWSIAGTETSEFAGLTYTQHWYVGGVEATPANLNTNIYDWAPTLPSFTVWPNLTASNCPTLIVPVDTCTNTSDEMYWRWSPVSYASTSSVHSDSDMTVAADGWNGVQSGLQLEPADGTLDIWAYDSTSLPGYVFGQTQFTSQTCNTGCFDQVDECTGECMDDQAVYYEDIIINPTAVTNYASDFGESTEQLAILVVTHELGHALQLAHPEAVQHSCSEVQSTVYQNPSMRITCGVSTPTSCDGIAVDDVYPDGVPYCPQGDNYCDGTLCD